MILTALCRPSTDACHNLPLNTARALQAWELYYNIFKKINAALFQHHLMSTLELQYVSPKLHDAKVWPPRAPCSFECDRPWICCVQVSRWSFQNIRPFAFAGDIAAR